MAITTMDGAIAGMQAPREFVKALSGTLVAGRPHSFRTMAGIPAAGAAPAEGIGGSPLTTLSGQLPFTNPVSGNSYLARLQGMSTQGGTLMLIDVLWENSGIDVTNGTTEQTFTSSALIPARDINGTTTGDGVYAAIEVITTLGTGTPTYTFKYNNTAGVTHTGTNIVSVPTASIAGSFYPISLAAGDTGIQQAISFQSSATMTSGSISAVLYRVLARLELTTANIPNAIDLVTSGFTRIYNNSCPMLVFIPNTTTTSNIMGHVIWTQG